MNSVDQLVAAKQWLAQFDNDPQKADDAPGCNFRYSLLREVAENLHRWNWYLLENKTGKWAAELRELAKIAKVRQLGYGFYCVTEHDAIDIDKNRIAETSHTTVIASLTRPAQYSIRWAILPDDQEFEKDYNQRAAKTSVVEITDEEVFAYFNQLA